MFKQSNIVVVQEKFSSGGSCPCLCRSFLQCSGDRHESVIIYSRFQLVCTLIGRKSNNGRHGGRLLAFEKANPQRIDSISSNKRIMFSYQQVIESNNSPCPFVSVGCLLKQWPLFSVFWLLPYYWLNIFLTYSVAYE
ncbi:hypothetical protein LINPERHAP1_LOCUS16454 [Linum perenne]